MTTLKNATIEELQAEIKRREDEEKKPKPLKNPNFQTIIKMAVEETDYITEHGCSSKDFEQYIYEEAMFCVYGKDIFQYINSKL